jgi:heme exporter protein B
MARGALGHLRGARGGDDQPLATRRGSPAAWAPGSALAAASASPARPAGAPQVRRARAVFFFVIVASLFPLGIGPDPAPAPDRPGRAVGRRLLATMLALSRLFAADYEDGTLEQLALSPEPFVLLAAAGRRHWLVSGLPLIVATVLALQYGLPADTIAVLVASLLLGTPVLSLVGAIGAALTLGVRGGGLLVALIVLPLYVPALVFGAGAVDANLAGTGAAAHLSLLGACLVIAGFFAPWAITAALRIALE